jgi:hypothetical protein
MAYCIIITWFYCGGANSTKHNLRSWLTNTGEPVSGKIMTTAENWYNMAVLSKMESLMLRDPEAK